MLMISLQDHLYGGKRLKSGDKFEVRGQSDARLLKALGRAIDYTPPPEPVYEKPKIYTRAYSTAAVVADVPSFVDGGSVDEVTKPKRAYRRRDMKADE